MAKIAAIGDVHGCLKQMDELLSIVRQEHSPDLIVFLGDYVDRGPNSRGVIARVRELASDTSIVFLKGNHDDMMAGSLLKGFDMESWVINGGGKTLSEYATPDEAKDDAKFLDALPTYHITQGHVFVHGGIPANDCELAGLDDVLMWYRGEQNPWRGRRVVHGHTPTRKPVVTASEINVDTGCVFGWGLTAAIIDEGGGKVQIVSVPSRPHTGDTK